MIKIGNRILFEASIDTRLFKRAIGDMKAAINSFFDMADARARVFSEKLGVVHTL